MSNEDGAERFDVLVTGELLPGFEREAVIQELARRYRVDVERIRKRMDAAPTVWKRNNTAQQAARHERALRRAGAVAERKNCAEGASGSSAEATTMLLPSAASVMAESVIATSGRSTAVPAPADAVLSQSQANGEETQEWEPADAADDERQADSPEASPVAASPTPSRRSTKLRWQAASGYLLLGVILGFGLGLWAGRWEPRMPQAADAAPSPETPAPETADDDSPTSNGRAAPERNEPTEPGPQPAVAAVVAAPSSPGVETANDDPPSPPEGVSADMSAQANKGPFGLQQGMPVDSLDLADAAAMTAGRRALASVPQPLPIIESVVALVSDSAGLCGIDATTHSIETTPDGTALRQAFAEIESMLDQRYGAGNRTNIRLSRTGDEGTETTWMQQLLDGERRFTSVWAPGQETLLAEDLRRISLTASADHDEQGRISIIYRFDNAAACMGELSGQAMPE